MLNPLIPELYCTDFKASLKFYVRLLEFEILYQREEDNFVMLERQDAQIMLEQLKIDERTWLAAEAQVPFGRGMNLQIKTQSIDTLYARVQNSGAKIFLEMEEKWYRSNNIYLGNKQFIVQDSDGYLLRFFEDIGTRASS